MIIKRSRYFRLRSTNQVLGILVSFCIFGSYSIATSQTPQTADASPSSIVASAPTATPAESPKSAETNQTKPSQFATDFATIAAGTYPWGLIILVVVLLIWLRKDIKALFNRFSTTASSFKVAGLEVQASVATVTATPPNTSSPIENETEKPPEELTKDSIEALEVSESESEVLQAKDARAWVDSIIEISRGSRDVDEMKRIFEAAQADETEPHQKLVNEIIYYYFRFRAGDKDAIDGLKTLTENAEIATDAYKWLSACYELSANYPKAIDALEKAIETSPEEIAIFKITVSLVNLI
jgi:hypothetical protein